MDITEANKIVLKAVKDTDFAGSGWEIRWVKAYRWWGSCSYWRKRIKLSKPMLLANPDKIWDTVVHEIAHAQAEGHGHGPVWQARMIKYGAIPRSCADAPVMPDLPWFAPCHCGKVHQKPRKPRTLRACKVTGQPLYWIRRPSE